MSEGPKFSENDKVKVIDEDLQRDTCKISEVRDNGYYLVNPERGEFGATTIHEDNLEKVEKV